MANTMDKIHSGLLRKYHTLCSRLGLNEVEKRAIVESYGVESSADMDTHDLIDVCNSLSKQLDGGKRDEADKLRKRVIASIGGYLRKTKQSSSIDMIKGVACRATGYSNFNKIPVERLRNLCYTFTNKQKDIDSVNVLTSELLANICIDNMAASTQIPN